jgi:hypothetical protein
MFLKKRWKGVTGRGKGGNSERLGFLEKKILFF